MDTGFVHGAQGRRGGAGYSKSLPGEAGGRLVQVDDELVHRVGADGRSYQPGAC
ncbi:hypothetical protein D3C84_956670 [compost metagenome]